MNRQKAPRPVETQHIIKLIEIGDSGQGYFKSTWDYEDNKILMVNGNGVILENVSNAISNAISNFLPLGTNTSVPTYTGGINPVINPSNVFINNSDASNFNSISLQNSTYIGNIEIPDTGGENIKLINFGNGYNNFIGLGYVPLFNTTILSANESNLVILTNTGSGDNNINIINQTQGEIQLFSAGFININSDLDTTFNTVGNLNLYCDNEINLSSNKSTYISSQGNIYMTGEEQVNINTGNNGSINITAISNLSGYGNYVNINSSNDTYLNGNNNLYLKTDNGNFHIQDIASGVGIYGNSTGMKLTGNLVLDNYTNGYLTVDGTGNIGVSNSISGNSSYVFSSINGVPAGNLWNLSSNIYIPYNSIGYTGYTSSSGDIVFNNGNSTFSLVSGIYSVDIVQSVNVNNSLGIVLSNGRIKIVNVIGNTQINQDSGRYETTVGMSTAGILAYNISLNMILSTGTNLEVGVYCEDSTGLGTGGLLLGKGSAKFVRIADFP